MYKRRKRTNLLQYFCRTPVIRVRSVDSIFQHTSHTSPRDLKRSLNHYDLKTIDEKRQIGVCPWHGPAAKIRYKCLKLALEPHPRRGRRCFSDGFIPSPLSMTQLFASSRHRGTAFLLAARVFGRTPGFSRDQSLTAIVNSASFVGCPGRRRG